MIETKDTLIAHPHVQNTRFRLAIKKYFYKDIEPEYTQFIEDLIINGSIESLDTLKELAQSLNNDANFYTTMMQKFSNIELTIEENELIVSTALNDLEARKQDNLESNVNIKTVNGESLVGSGDITITTNRPFNSSWRTNTTLADFCSDVVSDSTVLIGNSYLGELRCSGLPTGMVNGEVRVDVLGESNNNKILLLTVTSTNLAPYHYELTYFMGTLYGWRSFMLSGTQSDWTESDSAKDTYIQHKPTVLHSILGITSPTVSGDYVTVSVGTPLTGMAAQDHFIIEFRSIGVANASKKIKILFEGENTAFGLYDATGTTEMTGADVSTYLWQMDVVKTNLKCLLQDNLSLPTKENITEIQTVSSGTTLTAVPEKLYKFTSAVSTLTVTLTAPDVTTKASCYTFRFLTDSTTPSIVFNTPANTRLLEPPTLSWDADTEYEVSIMFDGVDYVLSYNTYIIHTTT